MSVHVQRLSKWPTEDNNNAETFFKYVKQIVVHAKLWTRCVDDGNKKQTVLQFDTRSSTGGVWRESRWIENASPVSVSPGYSFIVRKQLHQKIVIIFIPTIVILIWFKDLIEMIRSNFSYITFSELYCWFMIGTQ